MTLQEVIDKLVRLSNSTDEKSRIFQDHITKVEIEWDDHLVLTIKEKKQKGDKK